MNMMVHFHPKHWNHSTEISATNFSNKNKTFALAQFKNHADPGHLHRFLSVLEIPTGPLVRGRQLWRRTGNFFLFFFNFMLVIWDSRHEDLQLFWQSFKHWFLCISLITTRNFNGSNPHGSLALANAYRAFCSGYLGVSCDMNIFNRPVFFESKNYNQKKIEFCHFSLFSSWLTSCRTWSQWWWGLRVPRWAREPWVPSPIINLLSCQPTSWAILAPWHLQPR